MVQMLGGQFGNILANRKSTTDFMREAEEFEAAKKQRAMSEELGNYALKKARREASMPVMPFSGDAFDAQVGNIAFEKFLSQTGDPVLAKQMAADAVLQTKVNTKMVEMPDGSVVPISEPRATLFGGSQRLQKGALTPGINPSAPHPLDNIEQEPLNEPIYSGYGGKDPVAASRDAIARRTAEIGANPYQRIGGGPQDDIGVIPMNTQDINELVPSDKELFNLPAAQGAVVDTRRGGPMSRPVTEQQMMAGIENPGLKSRQLGQEAMIDVNKQAAIKFNDKLLAAPDEARLQNSSWKAMLGQAENIDAVANKAIKNANSGTTGFLGSMAGVVPGSAAFNLKENMKTIEADSAFTALKEMRDNNKTGGALGSITERELALLGAAKAALSTSQGEGQFKENLARYIEVRDRAMRNVAEGYREQYGFYPEGYDTYVERKTIDTKTRLKNQYGIKYE